jgi:hypothetical protein
MRYTKGNQSWLAALLAASLLWTPWGVAQNRASDSPRTWKLQGAEVTLRLADDCLIAEDRGGTLESIPLDTIIAITYDAQTRHPVPGAMWKTAQAGSEAAMGMGQAGVGAVFLTGAVVAAMVPFLPLRTTKHFVEVQWQQEGTVQAAVFRLRKKDARSLLQVLSERAGVPVRDLAAEREALAKQRKAEARKPKPSGADKPVGVLR